MTRRSSSFGLAGGLDEVTQPLALSPGKAIACLNHEVVDAGYARVGGFERLDGRPSPTDAPFWLLDFIDGATAITAGQTVTGGTSGATGVVLVDVEPDGGAWDGEATGYIGLRALTGTFVAGEDIEVSSSAVAKVATGAVLGLPGSADAIEQAIAEAARDHARGLIAAVPGSGVLRGVCELNDTIYAFRDNVGGTACVMHEATSSGWQAVNLGHSLAFTSGGTTEISEGDTITGATSGATATVARIVVQSGDWAAGDAAGYMTLAGITGTFSAENLNVGASTNLATIAGAPVANTIPAGGRYFFVAQNFYGAESARALYGCNGVGPAFEFDGTTFTSIATGMVNDTPNRIAVFRNHLFLAFDGGSVQHSAPGDPLTFDPEVGTVGEIAFGSDVADFIQNIDSLLILCEHGIYALTGYDVTDWVKSTITEEAGAKPFTGQRFGPGLYLDNRGLRSVNATQAYGNFAMGTFSAQVEKTLARKRAASVAPVASCIVRTKNHYRLFFADGTGLSFYLGRKTPESMSFDLGKIVRCISSTESPDGGERVLFGSDDGYVYQLDKGISFDGEPIEAFCQLSYNQLGMPDVVKRIFKIGLEVSAAGATTIGVSVDFDYAGGEQSGSSAISLEAYGAGALWGIGRWGEFVWGAPVENSIEAHVDGQGRNVSLIIYSNSHLIAPYELRGATIFFGERGRVR